MSNISNAVREQFFAALQSEQMDEQLPLISGQARVGRASLGMVLSLQAWLEDGFIKQGLCHVYGCPSAIAVAHWLQGWLVARPIQEAENLTEAHIVQALDLSSYKKHYAVLAVKAVQEVLNRPNDYHQ